MSKEFDIVIFGATGYTGKLAFEELAKYCAETSSLTWAIAGRNDTKMEKVLASVADITGAFPPALPSLS